MSWLFSRVLAEEFLPDTSSDGEQSAPLSGSPTPLAYCAPDKMTAFSRLSRSGMTFKPLTVDRGEELLMSFLAVFPVKTSPSQETKMDLRESDQACGEKWRGWLAKYDHASSSWKTAQCSLLSEEPELLEILPRSGMTRDGLLWELPTSARPTKEIVSGLWPTPNSRDWKDVGPKQGNRKSPNLGTAVHWPTPAARDYKGANAYETTQKKLEDGKRAQMGQLPNAVQQELGRSIGGSLNPTWVEWLMGWPLGWTDLKPLEMDKSPCVQQQHGENSTYGIEP